MVAVPIAHNEHDLTKRLVKAIRSLAVTVLDIRAIQGPHRGEGSPAGRGWPDLMLVLPGGRVRWVELKMGKTKLKAEQEAMALALRELGHEHYLVRCFEDRAMVQRSADEASLVYSLEDLARKVGHV